MQYNLQFYLLKDSMILRMYIHYRGRKYVRIAGGMKVLRTLTFRRARGTEGKVPPHPLNVPQPV